jgi:dTDP-4-dehydrorhamnose 3,5-epimerase
MRDVSLFETFRSVDSRGNFTKIIKFEELAAIKEFQLEEAFITSSNIGVIRGMHVQVGSAANWRLIQVLRGEAFDVLLDLRKNESTFGKIITNILSSENPQTLLVPPGVAHGFQALSPTDILYLTSHRYEQHLDTGVNPLSLEITWPLEVSSISDRDLALPSLLEYQS